MTKNLVIVESPAKAKTIEKFLGKDFIVRSSYGHIRDLPSKGMNIDIAGGTFDPTYAVNDDKKAVVRELKKYAKDAEVWLAADEDREGEAIAWHVCHALKLDPKKTKRIVFHEITKSAITEAVKNPRTVDQNLVDAQQARRVLDRLVGYELSPVLWKKVQAGLSAGRVQSVAVRIIVERERSIETHEAASTFKTTAEFVIGKGILRADLPKKFKSEDEAKTFIESCLGAEFTVKNLEMKPGKKSPTAPFTTSTLQQEASRKLGFSVKQTMMVAQKLYEAGKITYMRTDSVNLSEQALGQAAAEIEERYGKNYIATRKYKTKNADAQEAHEAIRPTDFRTDSAGQDSNQKRLYELIWKRSIASQMAEALIEKTTASIEISTNKEILKAQGEVIKFPGFLEVYIESSDDEGDEDSLEKNMLPPIEIGEALTMKYIKSRESFTRPPARFTEASLVKKMEEEGIGRPSTYAPTISTIQNRKYIEKRNKDGVGRKYAQIILEKEVVKVTTETEMTGTEKNKLFPTDLGEVVSDFLVAHFSEVVDYGFTRKVEEDFDNIASGKQEWKKMIKDFYKPFHEVVEKSADISRESAGQSRELGVDPKSGKPVIARLGRFGAMIQIGTKDDEEKPRFASIPEGQSVKTITYEEAMELFSLPRIVGQTPEGEDMGANFGRFGPYIKVGSLFVSIKPEDPFTITLEKALELVAEKKEKEKNKYINVWEEEEISVLRGPYGIYIKAGKKNVKIPKEWKDKETDLTLELCKEIIEKAPAAKPKRGAKKAPAKKKKPAKKK